MSGAAPKGGRRVRDLRRQNRLSAVQLSWAVRVPRATVGRILRCHPLSRWRDLDPPPPPQRCNEHVRPALLLHLAVRKLGKIDGVGHRITDKCQCRARGIGWEGAPVAIDDCIRLGYVEILPAGTAVTATGPFEWKLTWMNARAITCRRLLTHDD